MLKSRKLKDPYYGRGFEVSIGKSETVSYSAEVMVGLTDSLFKFNLAVTSPFDNLKFNTRGDEDTGGKDLIEVSLKVAVLWVQLSIGFNRVRNWWLGSGMKDGLEALMKLNEK